MTTPHSSSRLTSADVSQQLAHLDAALDAARRARMASTRAEHALDAFSQSVSHDLRAPLRAIEAYATALIEECGLALSSEGHRYVERILASAGTLSLRVDALLRLSHLSRGHVRRDVVDLSALAHGIVSDLRRAEPGRRVTVDITPDLRALGDTPLLSIVLENLLLNAWKFTRHAVEPHVVFTAVDGFDGRVFRVADNGVGFDMSHASRLFLPFQRLHDAAYEGTGVGLASTRRIVERHGGRIWAAARPNEGATFFFTLGSGTER
jgi:signal transduction histidine kinase